MATRKNYSGGTNRSTGASTSKRVAAYQQAKRAQSQIGPRGSDKSLIGRMKQNKADALGRAANYKPAPKKRTR